MPLADLLAPEAVFASLRASSKKQALQELAHQAAALVERDQREVFETLLQRERLGSTGVGSGIAIPHGKLPGLTQIVGVFARLAQPVDFQAVDDMPVDLVFAMFSPADAGSAHLKALARISRRLRDKGFVAKLRGAGSPDAIWALLTQDEARDAAA